MVFGEFRAKNLASNVATIFRSFSGNETSDWGTGWLSGNILDLPEYVTLPKILEKVQKKLGEQDV